MQLPTFRSDQITLPLLQEEVQEGLNALRDANSVFRSGEYNKVVDIGSASNDAPYLTDIFEKLYAYAMEGSAVEFEHVSDALHAAFLFVLLARPSAEFSAGLVPTACENVLQAAVARFKIDQALKRPVFECWAEDQLFLDLIEGGSLKELTIFELSLLARMNTQSIRNALKHSPELVTSKLGNLVIVEPASAYEWLRKRQGFIDTTEQTSTDSNVILVPEARDGSRFLPSCKQGNGYKIGKKGEEVYVEDYNAALNMLRTMPKAYWRRPSNSTGKFGIVSAIQWVPVTR
jgi:hypothetical protein